MGQRSYILELWEGKAGEGETMEGGEGGGGRGAEAGKSGERGERTQLTSDCSSSCSRHAQLLMFHCS